VVYCSLNVGASGIIQDDESMNNIRINKKSIGDIVRVQVSGFDKSGKVILKYAEQPLNTNNAAPAAIYDNAKDF